MYFSVLFLLFSSSKFNCFLPYLLGIRIWVPCMQWLFVVREWRDVCHKVFRIKSTFPNSLIG